MNITIPEHILFEDDVILVINKPAGLMVEPDRNNHPNLLQQVKKYLTSSTSGQAVYAQHLHRLDRPVSGIVLFAKERSVLKNLSEQFAERMVEKYYQALTAQAPRSTSGTLTHWHRKEKKKAVLYNEAVEHSELATLSYRVSGFSENRFQWDIELQTGKYHQIRAQLAYSGCPIIGDSLYGSTVSYHPNAIALHSWKLKFYHPVTNTAMSIEQINEFKE
jgi:23S rRNA pseudouridine955/2504/2580 synthase/23S rRNA pseudouridine1911/1915/1917 synthase